MRRREFLASVAAASVAAGTHSYAQSAAPIKRKGRIKQALFRQVFGQPANASFDAQCQEAARLGCVGFDLIQPADWPTLKKYGLAPTMAPMSFTSFEDGLIHRESHDKMEKALREEADVCAAGGCTAIISASGQRKGMSYEEAADHAVAFLNRVKGYLEMKGVSLCIENMNSRYPDNVLGRPDQACDHASWGFEVCKRVNSPRVKMLYDLYHAQVQDGNVCATIRDNFQWIEHFHTAGVPGRHEIDDTQELNYRFVATTIAELGFKGSIAHEYRVGPGRDAMKSLQQALDIMDV